jgi:hypothetical protein
MRELTTALQITTRLGGIEAVAKLTGADPKSVYNWHAINRFPADTYCTMQVELVRVGCYARPHLWHMRGFLNPRKMKARRTNPDEVSHESQAKETG